MKVKFSNSTGHFADLPPLHPVAIFVLELSAVNLFNHNPPFLNNVYENIGYDEENGDLAGRNVGLAVRLRW